MAWQQRGGEDVVRFVRVRPWVHLGRSGKSTCFGPKRTVAYVVVQKTLFSNESTVLRPSSSSDSNFHCELPSSFTSCHHRRPTRKRPLTFFTFEP